MTVNVIGSAGSTSPPTNPSANISIEDFLRILTTQLNNQDPLKPMDNAQFVAQLAQFTSLQEAQQSNDKLDTLLTIQAATQSVGLIGRTVTLTSTGQSGSVNALDFSSGQALLSVNVGTSGSPQLVNGVSMSSISNIR